MRLRLAFVVLTTTCFALSSGTPGGPAAPAATSLTATTPKGKIVIAQADGSGRRIFTSGWSSSLSPDNTRLAVNDFDLVNYQARNFRLELFSTASGTPTNILKIQSGPVTWSPDSTKLACVQYRGSSQRLLVIDAATGATTQLATGFFDAQLSFSPDSTKLAYVHYGTSSSYSQTSGKLKVVDLATRATATIRSAASSPAWGPSTIAFSTVKRSGPRRYTFNAALIQPDGTGFRQLTRFRSTSELWGPLPRAWSADGKRLLAGIAGLDAWTFRESYAVDPVRGGMRLIAHRVSPAALSRDGRYVIGQTGDAETTGLAGSNVVRVPWARGGKRRILLRHAVAPSFNG